MKQAIKYSLIKIKVNTVGETVSIDEETDKQYSHITGINILVEDPKVLFSTLTLQSNNVEIFPENWEIIRCRFRETAPLNFDFHELNLPAGGIRIKGQYKDSGQAQNYPYTVSLALRLENK